jgi:hypothetical protein
MNDPLPMRVCQASERLVDPVRDQADGRSGRARTLVFTQGLPDQEFLYGVQGVVVFPNVPDVVDA